MKEPAHAASRHTNIEPLEARIAPAAVISINRQTPPTLGTGADTLVFRVTFDETVTGVDATDFKVVTTGDAKADAAVNVAVVSGSIYDVTVSHVQGNGTLGLNLIDNDSIASSENAQSVLGGSGVNNGSVTGKIYEVLQTMPQVSSITPIGSTTTNSATVSWTVTFTEDVTGVDASDFDLVTTGSTTSTGITSVTAVDARTYTVTAGGVAGAGTIGLNLDDDETVRDTNYNNPLRTAPVAFTTQQTTSTAGQAESITSGDVNGDGKPDLVVTNKVDMSGSGSVSVLLGNGDGTFQARTDYITAPNPTSVALADVNGDGILDIVTNGFTPGSNPQILSVLLGNGNGGVGDGTFGSRIDSGFAESPGPLVVGNMDGDGDLDVVVVSSNFIVQVASGNRDGTFGALQAQSSGGARVEDITLGDVDGDGDLDVVTANYGSNTVSVLLNNGSGGLSSATTFQTASLVSAVAVGDVNGDGFADIVAAGYIYMVDFGAVGGRVSVLLGSGDGNFSSATPYSAGKQFSDVQLADFNGDGILDIAASESTVQQPAAAPENGGFFGAPVHVFLGVGNGTFNEAQSFTTSGSQIAEITVADFDGDGKADIASAHKFNANASALVNTGNGSFTGDLFTIIPPQLDLAVTSLTDVVSAAPGGIVTYTINYANQGFVNASGVTLTVPLDSQLNFVASENTAQGWTLNQGVLTKTIGGLNVSGTGSTTLILHVNNTIDAGYSGFGTTVTIAADQASGEDADPADNSKFDYANLTGLTFDPKITDIVDPKFVTTGGLATFTIHYSNTGNYDAGGKVISFTLPSGASVNTALSPGWSSGTGTVNYFPPTIPADGSDQTIDITVNVGFQSGSPTVFVTSAEIDGKDQVEDSNANNNTANEETPYYHGFVVTAPGVAIKNRYAPPIIRVLDRLTGEEIYTITAYEGRYRDSIRIATGDLNGDGIDDIVTTTMHNGGKMRFFDGATGARFTDGVLSQEIAVFGKAKQKGAFVAVGNVNGFGRPEIIVGSALGGGTVKVYSLDSSKALPEQGPGSETLEVLKTFTPFGAKFKGGVRVAAGDVDLFGNNEQVQPEGGGKGPFLEDDIVVGQGFRGGRVIAYQGLTDTVLLDIKVGGDRFKGGVSVALGDINDDGHADIIVGRNTGKPSVVEAFSGRDGLQIGGALNAINPFDEDPLNPKNSFGVRVATADVNGDGIADIITSVGIKNSSQVKFYDGAEFADGNIVLISDRTLTAYSEFPNVALWVAGSQPSLSRG